MNKITISQLFSLFLNFLGRDNNNARSDNETRGEVERRLLPE